VSESPKALPAVPEKVGVVSVTVPPVLGVASTTGGAVVSIVDAW
jgi:hypothetical protein